MPMLLWFHIFFRASSMIRVLLSALLSLQLRLSSLVTRRPEIWDRAPFRSALDAKRAIADHLGMPLAKLAPDQLAMLNALLHATLAKQTVWDHVRHHLEPFYRG
jgi:hypothetical protein